MKSPVRRRTGLIQLGLTSAMALALTGCGRARRCIDASASNVVVDNRYCETQVGSYPYRWYYGGSGFRVGSPAFGGNYGSGYGNGGSSSTTTTRGGFGGTADGHGSSSGHGSGGAGE